MQDFLNVPSNCLISYNNQSIFKIHEKQEHPLKREKCNRIARFYIGIDYTENVVQFKVTLKSIFNKYVCFNQEKCI